MTCWSSRSTLPRLPSSRSRKGKPWWSTSTTPTRTLAETSADGSRTEGVGELLDVIAALREHCPWMGALTHEALVEYLLEEAYEVAETIETGRDEAELKGELGDVLLQVV